MEETLASIFPSNVAKIINKYLIEIKRRERLSSQRYFGRMDLFEGAYGSDESDFDDSE